MDTFTFSAELIRLADLQLLGLADVLCTEYAAPKECKSTVRRFRPDALRARLPLCMERLIQVYNFAFLIRVAAL